MGQYQEELRIAKKAAIDAGEVIAQYYKKQSYSVTHKSDHQPLTEADLAANSIIKEALRSAFPSYGWLSEEDVDNLARFETDHLWVIDPLDGTKDFIHQNPEFAVSIALVFNKEPVVGVVYNPITKELFWAEKNHGAFCGDKPLSVSDLPANKPSLIVSMSEHKRGEWTDYESHFAITPTGGCAYKMAKVARGDADGTFTLSPKSEWDICAGHIIIEEAGGIVTHLDGDRIQYNQEITKLNGLIYCNHKDVHQKILKVIPKNFV